MPDQVSSLERDIEETRDRLAATIDELVYRISPKTIARRQVADVKAYFVDEQGAPRQDNILKVVGGVAATVLIFGIVRHVVRD